MAFVLALPPAVALLNGPSAAKAVLTAVAFLAGGGFGFLFSLIARSPHEGRPSDPTGETSSATLP